MDSRLWDCVDRWCARVGVPPGDRPSRDQIESGFAGRHETVRDPATDAGIRDWELRHGYQLPESLKVWLQLSDGFTLEDSLIHPLSAIGPMVAFARIPNVVVQPESWFEIGNPGDETICIDLAYQWPGGDFPVFTSGDDQRGTQPRIINVGFTAWFLRLLFSGGRPFWFEADCPTLGEPWASHQRFVPRPELPDTLRPLAADVGVLIKAGADDRYISNHLGISRLDVESILRHLQHVDGNSDLELRSRIVENLIPDVRSSVP